MVTLEIDVEEPGNNIDVMIGLLPNIETIAINFLYNKFESCGLLHIAEGLKKTNGALKHLAVTNGMKEVCDGLPLADIVDTFLHVLLTKT